MNILDIKTTIEAVNDSSALKRNSSCSVAAANMNHGMNIKIIPTK